MTARFKEHHLLKWWRFQSTLPLSQLLTATGLLARSAAGKLVGQLQVNSYCLEAGSRTTSAAGGWSKSAAGVASADSAVPELQVNSHCLAARLHAHSAVACSVA